MAYIEQVPRAPRAPRVLPAPRAPRGSKSPTFQESLCHMVGLIVSVSVAVLLLTALILLIVTGVSNGEQRQLVVAAGNSTQPAAEYNTRIEWQMGYLFLIFGCAMTIATVLYFCWIAKYGHAIFGCWTIRALKSPREHKILDNFRNKESIIIQHMWNNNDSQKNLTQFDHTRPSFDESIVKPTAPNLSFQENMFQINSTPRGEEETPAGAASEHPADLSLDEQLKVNLEEGNTSKLSQGFADGEKEGDSSQILVNASIESTPKQQQEETQDHPTYMNVQERETQTYPHDVPPVLNKTEKATPVKLYPEFGPEEMLLLNQHQTTASLAQEEIPLNKSYQVEPSAVAVKVSKTIGVGSVEVVSPFKGGDNTVSDPPYSMHIGEKLKMDVGSPSAASDAAKQDLIFSTTAVQQVGTPYRQSGHDVQSAVTVVHLGEAEKSGHGISIRVGEQIYDTPDSTRSDESTLIVRSIKHWQTRSLEFGAEDFDETGIDDTLASSFMYAKNDDVFLPSTPAEFGQGFVRPQYHSEVTPLPSAIEDSDASVQTPVEAESNIVIYQPMHPPTQSSVNQPIQPSMSTVTQPLTEDNPTASTAPITIHQPIQPTVSTTSNQMVEPSISMVAQPVPEAVIEDSQIQHTAPITIHQPMQPPTSTTLHQSVKPTENTIVYEPKSFANAPTFEPYPEISTFAKSQENDKKPSTSQGPDAPSGVSHFYHNVSTIEQARTRAAESQKTVTFEQLGTEVAGMVADQGLESGVYLTPAKVALMDRSIDRRSVRFDISDPEPSTTATPTRSPWKGVKDIESPYILANHQPIPTATVPYPQYNIYQPGPMRPVLNPLYGQRTSQISIQSATSQTNDETSIAHATQPEAENPLRLDLSQMEDRPPTPPTSWMMSTSQSQCVLEEIPSPMEQIHTLEDLL